MALACGPAAAQTDVTVSAQDVFRVESWSFFEPPPGDGDPDYTFFGNRLSLAIAARGPRWEAEGAFQYIQLEGLPSDAGRYGGMGTGAFYFYSAQNTFAYQLYARRLNLQYKGDGFRLTVGRMGYASGMSTSSGVPSLDWVKRERLRGRLVGEFEWSIAQRAFDGARLDMDRGPWHLTGAMLLPTQGGFEESGTPTIERIQLGTLSLTRRPGIVSEPRELQAFAVVYRDRRAVGARPDNSGLSASEVNVTVATVGGSQVGIVPTVAGEVDTLAWGAVQWGDWYGQPHRAWSLALEVGHRWTGAPGRPWLRVGYLRASGDGDGGDHRHGTFFQMLPDTRIYAQSATYAQMNLEDWFVQAHLEPHNRVRLRGDVHWVDLAEGADGWYTGSGATARTGAFFGFTSRPAPGATDLGRVIEGSADVRLNRHWSVNGYLGWMRGGDVVRRTFAGDQLTFFYLENVLRF